MFPFSKDEQNEPSGEEDSYQGSFLQAEDFDQGHPWLDPFV